MKPRYAAALALVGWYLMTPPIQWGILANGQSGFKMASELPLSEWVNVGSYDSAQECQTQKLLHWKIGERDLSAVGPQADLSNSGVALKGLRATQKMLAECISTDDPRLKGN